MKEIKKQFGRRHGSRLTLAPDYWYLRGSEPAEMQNYIDWVGSRVRLQTNITNIEKNLKPLWKMGCSFIPEKGGAAGSCNNLPGVLSNREIKRIIKEKRVGYDDAGTYAMKEAFANPYCLGGIITWSIDFDDFDVWLIDIDLSTIKFNSWPINVDISSTDFDVVDRRRRRRCRGFDAWSIGVNVVN
ncbi:glycoside hydrolase family 18 protein [Bipolaris maydis ATCC 48331]|uniref:Glycoside hydrolase family 18 protein n=2 Tax=Cochliobolus heterostrophus TaxID=5016 RepID=M2T1R3_COCH5|nr:glycoside hydrolase family 18 protein [Bipolaris maydis ATCC 48331]EMD91550.1 glycoside hydrolase family 18 protein [Bipolaris maydis C5]KAJ5027282.1 hypothetical protein J3E73DRAFT_369066 [Bipolaris maydis]ENI08692.1 glycoside hydrolase family 18 protein [Bipolaris maydis ATCC 48331]KAJ5058944.1 hypothetical protein J3E74DRAFT_407973 [Bipolaris maydis]KAJ6202533.1 hypothetical protein J3E72DRAFT_369218 [Bipolaris maydis]